MKTLLKFIAPLVASAFIAGPAAAVVTLTLTDVSDKDTNNPEDVQCLMYGNSCPSGQQDMDVLNYAQKGSETEWKLEATPNQDGGDPGKSIQSPYTVGYITQYVSDTFGIGIDVNTTQARGETLQYFEIYINDVLEFKYTGPGALNPAFNGNGYFDFILATVDFSSFADSATVVFKTYITGQSDGAENIFLFDIVDGCTVNCGSVPEPASIAMIGLALAGLGLARRRRS